MAGPSWIVYAARFIGTKEIKGVLHSSQILKWWRLIRAPFTDDETPWCAAFVGGVLEEMGIRSTRSAAARSYLKWGVKLDKPTVGAIVVLWRGRPDGPFGHVGFVVGKDARGNIMVLGGNQADAVNVKPFDPSRVLSYHWPTGFPIHKPFLPELASDGKTSVNEA